MDVKMSHNDIIKIVLGLNDQNIPMDISDFVNMVDQCKGFKLYNKEKILEKFSLLDNIN